MSTVPQNAKLKLEWWEAHIAQIVANAVAVGTTTAATTDLSTKITTARTKYDAKVAAEIAAKVATSEWHSAILVMGTAGASVIDQIRGKAKIVGGNSIYELAGIPAPANPSPVAPPGQPTDLKIKLTQTGAFDMKWKCPNPVNSYGTTYNLFRYAGAGTPSDSDFSYIGGSGERAFTDDTFPSGVPLVVYKIQAVRSTAVGPPATFNVFIGKGSSGAMMIKSVVETTPAKLAA